MWDRSRPSRSRAAATGTAITSARPGSRPRTTGICAARRASLSFASIPLGRPRGRPLISEDYQQGLALRLTLDAKLQRAAEQALRHGINVAHENEEGWAANGGAIVALDPRNGAVRALASNPTFDPRDYVGRPRMGDLRPLLDQRAAEAANFPGLNRAIAGLYPAGSTWKPVTALAAMRERLVSANTPLSCTGSMEIDGTTFNNWNLYINEAMTLSKAMASSCDTYFYQLGLNFYELPAQYGSPLQKWASAFGFGKPTGLDLGGEERGLLPTPEWRRRTFDSEIDKLWKSGDSVQLAIGQKDLLVTPLQMARFYALIANGGRLVTPHLVSSVEQPGNRGAVKAVFSPPPRPVNVHPAELAAVREGLYLATHASYGTSTGVFGSLPRANRREDGDGREAGHAPGLLRAEGPGLVVRLRPDRQDA